MNKLTEGQRKEYQKRLRPMFYEVHANKIEMMRQHCADLRKELKRAEWDLEAYEKKAKKVEHNLGRAADSDLKGTHFIFFGVESL